MKFLCQVVQKLLAWTDRNTDTQTDMTENITYLHTRVVINMQAYFINSSTPVAMFYGILNKRGFNQESGCAKVANLAIRWIQWYCKIRQERNSNLYSFFQDFLLKITKSQELSRCTFVFQGSRGRVEPLVMIVVIIDKYDATRSKQTVFRQLGVLVSSFSVAILSSWLMRSCYT